MIDKTTAGHEADPQEVEAVLHNLCGYHLAEPDPLFRYTVLTREQVLFDALVAAIKRERGRALAEIVASGNTLTHVAEMTNLGSRQRVARLIALARAAEAAAAEVQAASLALEERLAAGAVLAEKAEAMSPALGVAVPITPGLSYDASLPEPSAVETPSKGPPADGPDDDEEGAPDPAALLEPTRAMPALAVVLDPTKEMPAATDDAPWWRREHTGAA